MNALLCDVSFFRRLLCLSKHQDDQEAARNKLLDQIAHHETYVLDIECKIRALEDAKIYLYQRGNIEQAKQKIVERRRLQGKLNNLKNVIYTCHEVVSQLEEHKVLTETATIMRRVRKQFNMKHGEKALATMEHLMDEHADLNHTLESINGVIAESASSQLDDSDIQAELDAIDASHPSTFSSPPELLTMSTGPDAFPSLHHLPSLPSPSSSSAPPQTSSVDSVNLMQLTL